jgi:hypothetical protein
MRLASLTIFFMACLPAYDNGYVPGGGTDAGEDSGGGVTGSGKFVTGTIFDVEDLKTTAGITIGFPGFAQAEFNATTDMLGKYKLEIPSTLLNMSSYFIIDGMYMGAPILKTLYLPRRALNGGASNTSIANHFFKNPTQMASAAGLVATALAGHGDIPSASTFTDDFAFMAGGLYQYTNAGLRIYRKFTVQLSVAGTNLDNTSCKPSMQCCYYYSDPSFNIDFTLTASGGGLVIVCPKTQTDEVTVKQTADNSVIFEPTLGMHPTGTWADISLPISSSAGVFIDWIPQ